MAVENYFNTYNVSLTQLTTNGTTLYVSQAAPIASGFRILIDSELMQVTAGGTTTTWTVIRNIEGTTLTSHSTGTPIVVVLTAGALAAILPVNSVGVHAALPVSGMKKGDTYHCTDSPYTYIYTGTYWQAYVFGYAVTEPVLSDFTQVKVDLSTFDSSHGGIMWSVNASSGYDYQVISTTNSLIGAGAYYVDAAFIVDIGGSNGKISTHIAAGTTTGSAFARSAYGWESSNFQWVRSRCNSPTSWESNAGLVQLTTNAPLMWLRVYDDGTTNRYFYSSTTGYTWIQRYSESRTSLFSPTAAGISFDTFSSTISVCHCVHFSIHL